MRCVSGFKGQKGESKKGCLCPAASEVPELSCMRRGSGSNLSPWAVTVARDLCSLLDLMGSAGAGLVVESTYAVTLVAQVLIFLLPFHVSLRTKILIWKILAHIT